MTDATGLGGVDGKGKAKGLEVELTGQAFAAEDEPVLTARGEEAGRQLEGVAGGKVRGSINWVFEANVIFLSGVDTSCSRFIDFLSEFGESCPSHISVSSRLALAADNLLSTEIGTADLGGCCFSRLGLFFCGELFLLDKLVEFAPCLFSLWFGRTDARGIGALGGHVRHSSGEERSRSGV